MSVINKLVHLRMHLDYKKYICLKDSSIEENLSIIRKESKNKSLLLCSIAFQNPEVIELQIKLLRKNLKDDFYYFIADNSLDIDKAKRIETICHKYTVNYLRLPTNPYNGKNGMPSFSNGAAMNYVFTNLIHSCDVKYFGFLDHDIFPIKSISLTDKMLKQKFWGVLRCMPSNKYGKLTCNYLWAGFCFFDMSYIQNVNEINFLPKRDLGDTGAANYYSVYYPVIKTDEYLEYIFANVKRLLIDGIDGTAQASQYECIDEAWIHYLNASNWSNEKIDVKEKKMKKLINEYLK